MNRAKVKGHTLSTIQEASPRPSLNHISIRPSKIPISKPPPLRRKHRRVFHSKPSVNPSTSEVPSLPSLGRYEAHVSDTSSHEHSASESSLHSSDGANSVDTSPTTIEDFDSASISEQDLCDGDDRSSVYERPDSRSSYRTAKTEFDE